MSNAKKLVKNTMILSLGTILPKVATFITLPIYTRYLTKSEYGIYDLILTLVSLLIPIITLQIQNAVFRNLVTEKDEDNKKKIISTGFIFTLIVSIILLVLYTIFFRELSILTRILIALYFILDILNQMTLQISRGLGKTKNYSINTVITAFLNLFLIIPLLIKMKLGLNGVLLSVIIAQFIAFLYLTITIHAFKYIKLKKIEKKVLKELLKYSIPLVPNHISWWLLNSSDKIIITTILGIENNAVYAASSKIPHIYIIMYQAFALAWQESASQSSEGDIEETTKYYTNIFKSLLKLLSGGIILLISATPILFKLLLNDSYVGAYYQIPILYIAMFFYSLSDFYSGIYVAIKKTKMIAKTAFIAAIINLVIDIALIKFIGLYAASISTLIAYLIITLYRGIELKKYYKIRYNYKQILLYMILILISCVLCNINNYYLNIINIIYAIICFIIMDREYINIVLKKLKLKKA